jgi:hypothetical protein
MDEMEEMRKAAALFARLGGKALAAKPGAMSRMGKLSAEKRALSRETLSKMGKKGGAARAAALTPERRSEIARIASAARKAKAEAAKKESTPSVGTENVSREENDLSRTTP